MRQPLTDLSTPGLGAGRAIRHTGALRLDLAPAAEPHLIADLNRGSVPFRDSWLARRQPEWYERRMAWIFPAWFLYFELEALK